MKPTKIAVLGLGRIGQIHLKNLVFSGRDITPVAITSSETGRQFAESLGVKRIHADLETAMEWENPDAVVICAPSDTHYDYVKYLIGLGKAIFCEKPLDLAAERIEELDTLARRQGIPLMVAFNRRFDPSFSRLREAIRAGKVGEPHLVRITSRDPAPPSIDFLKSSGGIFMDQIIHDFDMARYLLDDEVVEIYARGDVRVDPRIGEIGDWDTAVSVLTFRSGVLAVIDNSRQAVYGYDQRIEVFGSKGLLKVDNTFPYQLDFHGEQGGLSPRPYHFFLDRYQDSYRVELDHFLDVLLKEAPIPVGASDALASTRIALAAAESVRENRPVKLATGNK